MLKSRANRGWKLVIFLCLPANFVFRNSFSISIFPPVDDMVHLDTQNRLGPRLTVQQKKMGADLQNWLSARSLD